MVRQDKSTWKSNYFMRLIALLDEYPKCFIVSVDNVGSRQMQQIRQSLRNRAVVLMGKNTMIRKAIRGHMSQNPALEKLLNHMRGNVGFVFTREDLVEIRDLILENRVSAPARAGTIAPCDVNLPPQNTGMPPDKTSFFQALSIATKISKGTIEILNEIHLITKGDKVGASEAALLNMLNVSPFSYGLVIRQIYDNGTTYSPEVLDITPEILLSKFAIGISNVASVSLAINYPNAASVPHMVVNGLKNLISIAVETEISFKEAERAKEYIKDPSKFASAAPVVAASAGDAKADDKKEAKKEEPEESDEEDMGFDLFG
ncbi:60S acidic ribosomal protein P0, partial [Fragariocoptes setiger]